ncbi:MAG: hypothetical protein M1819_002855 [Sarea resinae]|nr:MAG: hypothetical protein M1819_002855 [Sarea resinae]
MSEDTGAAASSVVTAPPESHSSPSAPIEENKTSDAPSALLEKPAESKPADAAPDASKAASNGEPDQTGLPKAPETETKSTDAGEDTEMKDSEKADDAPESGLDASADVNGTPSSTQKSASKRKSTGGVPEHKSKKLNKKKSQILTHLDAQPGDIFFARLKGHAPWPSIIIDEEMLPQQLLATRPVTARRADGGIRNDFDDGGKRAHERTFPVMFLFTNEFAWIPNTYLAPLDPDTILETAQKSKLPKKLWAAYEEAAEKHDLAYYKQMLADYQARVDAELAEAEIAEAELEAEREAKEAAKAKASKAKSKSKRKSLSVPEDLDIDVEMEDASVEDDIKPVSKSASKKRKKDSESDGEPTKPAKTPKTATKLKLSEPKTPNGTTPSKSKAASAAKVKGTSTKKSASKAKAEVVETPKPEEKPLSAAEQQEKRSKEGKFFGPFAVIRGIQTNASIVMYLRHKLQRGLLTRDTAPKEDEMQAISDYISKLEQYPQLEVSIIRSTKINKVLKNILKLASIPRDDEFSFKKRSQELLTVWNQVLAASGTPAAPSEDKAATNGHKDEKSSPALPVEKTEKPEKPDSPAKEQEKDADKEEAKEDAKPEEKSEEKAEEKAEQHEEKTDKLNVGTGAETKAPDDGVVEEAAEEQKTETTDSAVPSTA